MAMISRDIHEALCQWKMATDVGKLPCDTTPWETIEQALAQNREQALAASCCYEACANFSHSPQPNELVRSIRQLQDEVDRLKMALTVARFLCKEENPNA